MLSGKLQNAFRNLRGLGKISESNVSDSLREVRMALRFIATEEMIALPDPFGTALRHRVEGGRLRIWSVGMNGTDDEGNCSSQGNSQDDILFSVTR